MKCEMKVEVPGKKGHKAPCPEEATHLVTLSDGRMRVCRRHADVWQRERPAFAKVVRLDREEC